MSLDLTQPLQTQDGTPVTLICCSGRDENYPVMGYIGDATTISFWTADGGHNSSNPHLDLKNLPITGEVWLTLSDARIIVRHDKAACESLQSSSLAQNVKAIIKLTYSVEPGHNDLED